MDSWGVGEVARFVTACFKWSFKGIAMLIELIKKGKKQGVFDKNTGIGKIILRWVIVQAILSTIMSILFNNFGESSPISYTILPFLYLWLIYNIVVIVKIMKKNKRTSESSPMSELILIRN